MIPVKTVRQAQAGEPEAQAALYEAMYKRVYYLALRMTRREEDAEDVTQETFLSAFRALPNLNDPNAFEGWLFQIAANQSRKLLRKTSRLADLPEDEDGRTMLDDLPEEDEGLIPAAAVEKDSERRILLDLIEELPEQQRQCVYLFYYAQMDIKAIAQVMECSEGTVKSRLNYARQKLRSAVLATEERDGIRLHALVPMGLLLLKDCQLSTAGIAVAALGGGGAAGGAAATAGATAKTGLFATVKAKVIAGITAAAIVAGGGAAILSQQPKPLEFTDPAMEANLRVLLEQPEDPLYPSDMEDLYALYVFADGMAMESGDGSPVTEPAAGTVPVGSLSDLSQLPQLHHLYFSSDDLSLLDTLSPMPQLRSLVAVDPRGGASDLSFLEQLPSLEQLSIQVTSGADLTPLEGAGTLRELWLSSPGAVTLDASGLTSLRSLTLHLITAEGFSAGPAALELSQPLSELRALWIWSSGLDDLTFLEQMPALQFLDLSVGESLPGLDLSPMAALQQLRCVGILGNYDDTLDLAPLSACPALEVYYVPNGTVLNPPPQAVAETGPNMPLYNGILEEIYQEIYRYEDTGE